MKVKEAFAAGRRGSRQASSMTRSSSTRPWPMSSRTASCSGRDRQDRQPQRDRRRRGVAGRAARPAAAGRGHHGEHQVRHDPDRPYPVHRFRRLPPVKPSDLIPELQGPLPHPRRAGVAVGIRLRGHPDPDRCQPDQAVPGAAGHRRGQRCSRRTASAGWPRSPSRSTKVENIGARRLYTVMERLLEDLSFHAAKSSGETITVDAAYVDARRATVGNEDLSRYVL